MKSERLYICNLIFRLLPETRFFSLKVRLLRWAGAKIGTNVRVCSSATILGVGALEIGDDTWVGYQVLIHASSSIQIGRCVDIAPRVFLGNGTHLLDPTGSHSAGAGVSRDIIIGDGVWLGATSTILPGLVVGAKAVVGAGAVVTKDIPEKAVVAGVPAKLIRTMR